MLVRWVDVTARQGTRVQDCRLFNLRLPHVCLFLLLCHVLFVYVIPLFRPFFPLCLFSATLFFLLNPPHPTIFLAIFFVSVSLFVGALALSQFYLLRSSGR